MAAAGPELYFLTLHEPYTAANGASVNATIVSAATLRHPRVPQPDGGRIYRCIREFPGRSPGAVVPVSTLTHELDGGELWEQVGDWEKVVTAVVDLSRRRECDAIPLGMPELMAASLASGPTTLLRVHDSGGGTIELGRPDRQRYLDEVTKAVQTAIADGPLWPGDGLIDPPHDPPRLPYRPYRPGR